MAAMKSLFGVRKVKYRYLSALIGQKVEILDLTHVEDPVLATVLGAAIGNFRLQDSVSQLTSVMWRHGFLDLTFLSSEELLGPEDRLKRSDIRELGYSPRPEDPAPDLDPSIKVQLSDDRGCLEVLIESIQEQGCFLRLFLNSKWSQESVMRFAKEIVEAQSAGVTGDSAFDVEEAWVTKKMKERFPVSFIIEDACLSNSDAIWLARHGYL